MKIVITESQYNLIKKDIEEEYPTTWNVEEFRNLKSFNQRVKYCETNLTRISSGSSRIAYKIDVTKVLKLAKNKKGLAQNEVEISNSQDYMMDDIVAEVFNYDENNLWLEMELARKVTPKLFYDIVGIPFTDFADGVEYIRWYLDTNNYRRYNQKKPNNYELMWETDFVVKIFEMMNSYMQLKSYGDLKAMSSYGIVKRNGVDTIVLVDYGINDEVYRNFYR